MAPGGFLTQLPEIVVWLAGIALALVRWRHGPRASTLMLLALSLLLTLRLVGGYVMAQLPLLLGGGQGAPPERQFLAFTLAGCGQSLIAAVAWMMVLGAVFGRLKGHGAG
jgi:hypothetical protein